MLLRTRLLFAVCTLPFVSALPLLPMQAFAQPSSYGPDDLAKPMPSLIYSDETPYEDGQGEARGMHDDSSTSSSSAFSAAAGGGACYGEASSFICQCEALIAIKTNSVRKAAKKAPMAFNQRISYVSRLWSKDQARREQLSHDWFMEGVWADKYEAQFKEPSPAVAENVAYNFGFNTPEGCAAAFTQQWRESPGHYRNMVGNFKSIGVGVARGSNGYYYATQNFGY